MTGIGNWFRETPESLRLVAEESALLDASELIAECLEERQITRTVLADRLGVSRSEISQRLNGKRNLTVRTFGAMLHELGYRLSFQTHDLVHQRPLRHVDVVAGSGWMTAGARYTATGNTLQVVRHPAAS